jgi:hypothetical protein
MSMLELQLELQLRWEGLMTDDRLITEDQKEGVRQRLLAFLEEPEFSVSSAEWIWQGVA